MPRTAMLPAPTTPMRTGLDAPAILNRPSLLSVHGMVLKANTEQLVAADELQQLIWSGPAFWWAWVGATSLGWAVTYGVVGALSGLTGETESPLTRGVAALVTLVTVTLQWRALRPWMERAWRWIPVSFAGEAAGLALFLAAQ